MHQALRPYMTTGVAIVGASVLVAAPLTATPQAAESVVRYAEVEVMPTASSSALSTISTAIGAGLQIGIDTAAGLPLGLTVAAIAIINDPDSTADVINYLANSFLNPDLASGSVFSQIAIRVILPLASCCLRPLRPRSCRCSARLAL